MSEKTEISWTDVRLARSGPPPLAARDGDKVQARQRIAVEVRTGRRAHPNTLACVDCGHVWKRGERRHEYDHHLGYAADHHGHVQPVCTTCHHTRDNLKKRQTHCQRGHAFTPENTMIKPNGCRLCRQCRRDRERGRRDAAYWRNYRGSRHGK